jgi:hypothetical protein
MGRVALYVRRLLEQGEEDGMGKRSIRQRSTSGLLDRLPFPEKNKRQNRQQKRRDAKLDLSEKHLKRLLKALPVRVVAKLVGVPKSTLWYLSKRLNRKQNSR